jgi:hypothetical protein
VIEITPERQHRVHCRRSAARSAISSYPRGIRVIPPRGWIGSEPLIYGHGTAKADRFELLQERLQSCLVWRCRASDAATALEKGAVEFKVPVNRLMAVRR